MPLVYGISFFAQSLLALEPKGVTELSLLLAFPAIAMSCWDRFGE